MFKIQFTITHFLILIFVIGLAFALRGQILKTKWERMSVSSRFNRLESALQKHGPLLSMQRSEPLAADRIARLRQKIPGAPSQLFDLLGCCDYTQTKFFQYVDAVAIKDLPTASKAEKQFYYSLGLQHEGWFPDKYGCCRVDKHWRDGWIKIASFNGDAIFIDMDPAENGVPGQIVMLHSDGWYLQLMGYSIAHWLERIANQLEEEPDDCDPLVFYDLPPPR